MIQQEPNVKELLSRAQQQLIKPVTENSQRLLLTVNLIYFPLAVVYLVSEWKSTGQIVPSQFLGYVYFAVGITNAVAAIYGYVSISPSRSRRYFGRVPSLKTYNRIERWLRWISLTSVLFLSFCFMAGIGNPSSDSLLGDFALGHSLIILVGILLGRRSAFMWFLVVLGTLVFVTFVERGYGYEFNYLTKAESALFQSALTSKAPWALRRQQTLSQQHLNPPHASRYFNMWLAFVVIAYLSVYYFTNSSEKINKTIPTIAEDMQMAIQAASRQQMQQMHDEEERLLLQQEALNTELRNLKAQVNPHFLFNSLNYFYVKALDFSDELAEEIIMLANIMRYSMQDTSNLVELSDEISYMKQFIELHQLRNNHQLYVDLSVTGPVDQLKIIPFLLIGYLENAFKHGRLNDPAYPLVIQLEAVGSTLHFFTTNQKNQKNRLTSNRIGLANSKRRIELIYNTYRLNIEQDETRFEVDLQLETTDLKNDQQTQ